MTPSPRPARHPRAPDGSSAALARDARNERLRRRQHILAELGARSFVAEGFLDLLGEALADVVESLDVSHAALLERVPGSTLLVMRAGAGWGSGAVGQLLEYDRDDAFLGPIFVSHATVRVAGADPAHVPPLFAGHGIVSGLTVMLPGPHGPVGTLSALSRDLRHFDDDDEDFLRALANIFSWAIQRKGTEDGLLQSQLRLQGVQKMEAIGRLAGGIAHDFNNLVQAIGGYTEMLLKHVAIDDPMRKPAEEIKRAGDRAAALTRQLLAFSRQQVLQPRVLDLNAVVTDVEQLLRRLIGEDVELEIELPGTLGRVRADAAQLEQVLMNLAVNARDAMPDGGTLTIETRNVVLASSDQRDAFAVQPGPYVLLAVADTGTGMDAETRARAFDPFFTTKAPGHGTGLGLSTVYGIVKQSRGYIWLDSEPGQGTRARIYLPRVDEPLDEPAPKRASAVAAPHGHETLLIVEDEGGVRELMCEWMSSHGYAVLQASNGVEALAVAELHADPIDLLVADVVMPQMGGPALALRLLDARPTLRVIFMSGYADEAIGDPQMLAVGAAFLQKPFTLDSLLRRVREILDAPA